MSATKTGASKRALRAVLQAVAMAEPLQQELARRHGVSVGDVIALSRLRALGEATTTAFGVACGVRRSATTDLVDRLETAGLVMRCPHPSDRRARLVRVTDAGLDALAGSTLVHQSAIAERLARLSAEEQEQLAELLERLIEPADEEDPVEAGT